MIKRIKDIGELSYISSPLFPLIYTDLFHTVTDSDGVFGCFENGKVICLFSMKSGSAVLIKTGEVGDFSELFTFLSFLGVNEIISDFRLNADMKSYPLLCRQTECVKWVEHSTLSPLSRLEDYRNIYALLNTQGENFDEWFSLFSRKINRKNALCTYIQEDNTVKSVCAVTGIYCDSAVISGVVTNIFLRGKGYATKCVESAISELNKMNVETAFLWCENNLIEFYEKMNFSRCGEIYICEDFQNVIF